MRSHKDIAGAAAMALMVIGGCARAQSVAETPSTAWTVAPALRSSTTDGRTEAAAPPASLQPTASATYSAWLTAPAITSQAPAIATNTKPAALREPRPVAIMAVSPSNSAPAAAMNAKPATLREQQRAAIVATAVPAKPVATVSPQGPRPISADSGTVIQLPQSRSLEQSGTMIVDAPRP